MEIKKKNEEKMSIRVNQPIWRNRLQRISRNLPPEPQFRLPIFNLKVEGELFSGPTSRTTVMVAHFHSQGWGWALLTWHHMWTSQLTKRHLVQNVHYHITVEAIHHRTFRVKWTLHRMSPIAAVQKLCFYGQTGLFKINILFQKLNPRFTDSSLIKKIMYMRENGLPPNIVVCEHLRVKKAKANTLTIKWILFLYIYHFQSFLVFLSNQILLDKII